MKTVRLIREKAIIGQCNQAAEFTAQSCVLNKQLPLPAVLSAPSPAPLLLSMEASSCTDCGAGF